MSSLVFVGLLEHKSFAVDLNINSDSALGSSDLVREQEIAVDREALEVRVMDDIPEATHDIRWNHADAKERPCLLRQLVWDSLAFIIMLAILP